jgi:hypothetical protein
MAYEVVYDTNLKVVERSSQFPDGAFVFLGLLLLFVFIAFLLFISTRRRILKLEGECSLVKSSVKKMSFEVAKLNSVVSSTQVPQNLIADSKKSFSKLPELTEIDLERVVSLMISKAPVKVNKEKLKEMVAKKDIKALARALKMSTSEVEILLNLRRKGA